MSPRVVTSAVIMVVRLLLALLILSGTCDGVDLPTNPVDQQSVVDDNGSSSVITFIRWAQAVNAFLETIIESDNTFTFMDKIRRLFQTNKGIRRVREVNIPQSQLQGATVHNAGNGPQQVESKYVMPPTVLAQFQSCWSGYVAVPYTTTFACNGSTVTGKKYENMTATERKSCSYGNDVQKICLCPAGTVWVKRNFGKEWVCVPRLLLVKPHLENKFLCQDPLGKELGLSTKSNPSDFCLQAKRNATLSLNVNVSYRWMENDEVAGIHALTNAMLVFGDIQQDQKYITIKRGVVGLPHALERSTDLFDFVVSPNASDPYAFAIVNGHPLQESGFFEHVVYPFDDLSLLSQGQVKKVLSSKTTINKFFNGTGNSTLHNIERKLAVLPDAFITTTMMYMEIGFCSSVLPHGGLYARVWITIEDIPPAKEKYEYNQPLSPFIIAAIILGCLLVAGIVAAIVWNLCHRKIDVDDQLVIRAQELENHRKRKAE